MVGVGMATFALATAEANDALREQERISANIAKTQEAEFLNREKNVEELQDLIDLVEEFGKVDQGKLLDLSAAGNQFAEIGGFYSKIREEAGGFNADKDILLEKLREEQTRQQELLDIETQKVIERERSLRLAAATTDEAKATLDATLIAPNTPLSLIHI